MNWKENCKEVMEFVPENNTVRVYRLASWEFGEVPAAEVVAPIAPHTKGSQGQPIDLDGGDLARLIPQVEANLAEASFLQSQQTALPVELSLDSLKKEAPKTSTKSSSAKRFSGEEKEQFLRKMLDCAPAGYVENLRGNPGSIGHILLELANAMFRLDHLEEWSFQQRKIADDATELAKKCAKVLEETMAAKKKIEASALSSSRRHAASIAKMTKFVDVMAATYSYLLRAKATAQSELAKAQVSKKETEDKLQQAQKRASEAESSATALATEKATLQLEANKASSLQTSLDEANRQNALLKNEIEKLKGDLRDAEAYGTDLEKEAVDAYERASADMKGIVQEAWELCYKHSEEKVPFSFFERRLDYCENNFWKREYEGATATIRSFNSTIVKEEEEGDAEEVSSKIVDTTVASPSEAS